MEDLGSLCKLVGAWGFSPRIAARESAGFSPGLSDAPWEFFGSRSECGIIEQSFRFTVPTETINTPDARPHRTSPTRVRPVVPSGIFATFAQTSANAARAVTVHAKNGIELKATINGQGPFDAIFDTGSGNLMTASLAKRLGLKVEGSATSMRPAALSRQKS